MVKKDNYEINEQENFADIYINTKIFSTNVIHKTMYIFLENANVIVVGTDGDSVIVRLRPLDSVNLEELANRFNTELINTAVNTATSEENKNIRDLFISTALKTNLDKSDIL